MNELYRPELEVGPGTCDIHARHYTADYEMNGLP